MSYIGGDVLEVSYKHPTLGSGSFFVKAGEDTTIDLGGFRSDDDANGIAGDGQMMTKINAVRWSYEAPVAWSKTTTNELAVLSDLAKDPVDADWTISAIDLSVFVGKGRPVGDLAGATQDSTIPLKIAGGGGLRRL
jgi:hypothetical protein